MAQDQVSNLPQNQWVSPAHITAIAEEQVTYKATKDAASSFFLAMTAGVFIGLGFIFYTTVTTGPGDLGWGVTKLLGGISFSLGLMLLMVCGGELFTSTVLTTIAWASKRAPASQVLKTWVLVYFGNMAGSLLLVAIVMTAGLYMSGEGTWGVNAMNIAQHKLHHSFAQAVALGIMCNLMVCLAVWMSFGCKTNFEKAFIVMMPVAMFVAGGFEHCVANMFMVPLGISIHSLAGPEFWQAAGVAASDWNDLTVSHFVINNLIPVTIGNIIGGGIMVGMTYWGIFRRPALKQQLNDQVQAMSATKKAG